MKITKKEKEVFDYLNALRKSGTVNMFGAVPYIIKIYGLDTKIARKLHADWMENFSENGYDHMLED